MIKMLFRDVKVMYKKIKLCDLVHCRQYGLVGVTLQRIPNFQNSSIKMESSLLVKHIFLVNLNATNICSYCELEYLGAVKSML